MTKVLESHIKETMESRKIPVKREHSPVSKVAIFGIVLFLITILTTMIMQLIRMF